MKYVVWGIAVVIITLTAGAGLFVWLSKKTDVPAAVETQEQPEISGWIAWWKEEQAYQLVASRPGKIKTVSPVWWLVNEESELEDVGEADRELAASRLKESGVEIYPTVGSELTGNKLSPLFNDDRKFNQLTSTLLTAVDGLPIDGIDIDLEGIGRTDRDAFTDFLAKLKKVIDARGLKLSVTIQAQDGKNYWFGAEGQDIAKIGQIADEVRVMAYDRHSAGSDPGPIAPRQWISDVAKYNFGLIPKSKIVMGIPSYGYIWPENGPADGLQWDEFYQYLDEKEYTSVRDEGAKELKIMGDGFSGWLSDAEAMAVKVGHYRKLGLNRFIIWHLGGMDETIFDRLWPQE